MTRDLWRDAHFTDWATAQQLCILRVISKPNLKWSFSVIPCLRFSFEVGFLNESGFLLHLWKLVGLETNLSDIGIWFWKDYSESKSETFSNLTFAEKKPRQKKQKFSSLFKFFFPLGLCRWRESSTPLVSSFLPTKIFFFLLFQTSGLCLCFAPTMALLVEFVSLTGDEHSDRPPW